jgi:hypothetical protein
VGVAARVYLYGIALVGLGMLVVGAAGLLTLALETAVQAIAAPPVTIGDSDVRSRASLSGALTLIGLAAWLVHWGLAERAVRRPGPAGLAERQSAIRKLFLYLALALGGVTLTFADAAVVSDVLRALFGSLTLSSVISGSIVEPLSALMVVGVLELYYWRIAALDRVLVPEVGAGATLRRWATYGLAFLGLMLLLFSAVGLIEVIWEGLVVPPGASVSGGNWMAEALPERIGTLVGGLVLWLTTWRWSNWWFARADDVDPEGRSVLRKVYLYLVLAIAVAWTVWNLGRVFYLILRAALLPQSLTAGWFSVLHDLGPALAAVLVFGVAWLYHVRMLQHEAAVAGEASRQASIRWIYSYLVAFVGLATFAVGLAGTAATLLELLVQPGAGRSTTWWQERISLFTTLVVVGLPLWAVVWGRLQRETVQVAARRSLVRRIYLILVFGLSVLALIASGAVLLYQLIRVALGEPWTAGETSTVITAGSTVAVAALVLVYHLRTFRGDAPGVEEIEAAQPATGPIVRLALVRASSADAFEAYRQRMLATPRDGVEIEFVEAESRAVERIVEELRPHAAAEPPSG